MEDVRGNQVLFQSLQLKSTRTGRKGKVADESQARLHHIRPINVWESSRTLQSKFLSCQK